MKKNLITKTVIIFGIAAFINGFNPGSTSAFSHPLSMPIDQSCTDDTECSNGLECIYFATSGSICAEPDPCSYYECPEGTQCAVTVTMGDPLIVEPPIEEPSPPDDAEPESPSDDEDRSDSTPGSRGSSDADTTPRTETPAGEAGEEESPEAPMEDYVKAPPGARYFGGKRVVCRADEEPKVSEQAEPSEAPQEEDTESEEQDDEDAISYDLIQKEEAVFVGSVSSEAADAPEIITVWRALPSPASVETNASPEDDQQDERSSETEPSIPTGILEVAGTTAEYEGEVVVREGKLLMNTSVGEKTIEILPEVAVMKAKEIIEDTKAEVKNIKLRESAKTQTPIYEVKTDEKKRLFGLIPVSVGIRTTVSAEDATVVSVKRPWWRVFAW